MKITFAGAAHMVLGSCYYVETNSHKFLVDCGMFQGVKIDYLNYEPFPFNASELDFVILTHTHIDHSGLLPKLTRQGFKGKLYCTVTSAKLAELLLLDSAKIQESNLRKYNEAQDLTHTADSDMADTYGHKAEFMYSTADAAEMLTKIVTFDYDQEIKISDDLVFKFVDAGHILGAASVQMTYIEQGETKRILFSGDIGHKGQGLISFFAPAHGFKPDTILMEGTYGGKYHENRTDTVNKLVEIIQNTIKRGGNVIIPAFAAQRTQEILFEIKKAKMFNKLPYELEVYVDSPLASKITDIYQKSWQYMNAETKMFFENGDNAFNFPRLYFTRNARDSQFLNRKKGVVIISGSGMCSGGRVLYHLAFNLPNNRNSVILVGYQAEETLGRELADGAKEVTIDNKKVPVNAEVQRLFGFSGHADNGGLMEYFKQYHFENLKNVFVVHSDIPQGEALVSEIKELDPKLNVVYPNLRQSVEV